MAFNLFGISIPQISLPSLPKIEVPKIEIPKITVPDIPKIEVPKIKIPDIPKVTVPDIPKITVPDIPKIEVPKIKIPDASKVTLPPLPGLDVLSGAASIARGEMPQANIPQPLNDLGGWVSQGIDVVIGARDKSYEVGLEQASTGNVAGGGAQFGATMAADVILPLDLIDLGNKWMTGRGDEIDNEMLLGAAIDGLGLAGAVFTFGGSYAASRALKAGLKTVKVGGDVGKLSAISKLRSTIKTVGSTAKTKTLSAIGKVTTKTTTKSTSAGADVSKLLRQQAEATKKAYAKQARAVQDAMAKQTKALTKSLSGLKPAGETSKLATGLSRTGSVLTGAALGAGGAAIGLTALGALGAPAPLQEEEGGDGDGGALGGGDQVTGAGEDWWTEFMDSLYGGEAYDPYLYEGYDPYTGYYDPGYPDVLGVEPYAQDLLTYAEEVPVVGGVATAAKQSGFALPLIVGAIILVVLAVAFLRSKKGKAMVSGAKKEVSGAAKGAKKAVGA